MPNKPDITKGNTGSRHLKVAFPEKPVVFLDIVVKRFSRGGDSRRHGHAQLDQPPS
jgi:hypothetical protein